MRDGESAEDGVLLPHYARTKGSAECLCGVKGCFRGVDYPQHAEQAFAEKYFKQQENGKIKKRKGNEGWE